MPNGKQKLLREIRKKIITCELPIGSQLKATQKIAKEYNIALPTAHSGLRQLVDEGYLIREKGRGTFVAKTPPGLQQQTVCFLNSRDNQFSGFFIQSRKELSQLSIRAEFLDYNDIKMLNVSSLLKNPPLAVISDSIADSRYLIKNHPDLHTVCINDVYGNNFKGDVVTTNKFDASSQAVNHLIKLGHTRIACYSPFQKYFQIKMPPYTILKDSTAEGYSDALYDAGIEHDGFFGFEPGADGLEILEEMFSGKEQPTAVYCSHDHRAMELIHFANSKGMRVPQDLAVVSSGNSSWAKDFNLTSFDLREEDVVKSTIMLLKDLSENGRVNGDWIQHRIIPQLIVRESCGSFLHNDKKIEFNYKNEWEKWTHKEYTGS